MTYIPESLRRQVIEKANQRCEYCLVHQQDTLFVHEIDHIIPEKHRGETVESNLCLACFDCNRFKGSDFASFDPLNKQVTLLYHPRKDVWKDHFELNGPTIIPRTAVGRVTIFVLKLNLSHRLFERQALIEVGRYP
ncbi:MAG: HNH endonuclease [Anaerolineae bacterium]|jgi:hypothetical protein|nr:HNH endonuclease [Anaerolineae bacterium]